MSERLPEDRLDDALKERDEYKEALNTLRDAFYEKIQELSIIRRTGEAMLASMDRKTLCSEIISIFIDETEAENCSLWLISKSGEYMELTAARGQTDSRCNYFPIGMAPKKFRIGDGVVGKVAKTGEQILIENVSENSSFVNNGSSDTGIKSLLCIPIKMENHVHGVLNLSHPDIGAFSQEKGRLLDLIANQAALAITNYLIVERLRFSSQAIESISEGLMVTDANSTITFANPAVSTITGYSNNELLGKTPCIFKSGNHADGFYSDMWDDITENNLWEGEIWNRKKNGETYLQRTAITATRDENGNIIQYSSVFFDITQQRTSEDQLEYQAYHDALTDLPNRLLYNDRLKKAIARAHRKVNMVGVTFIDLDNFKNVNDLHGHSMGDLLLQAVARRLKESLRDGDTVARFGGDEFAILIEGVNNERDGARVIEKLTTSLSKPYLVNGYEMVITVSAGISYYPVDGEEIDTLLKNADTAMYHAKEKGKNHYELFDRGMNDRVLRRLELEQKLRSAIKRKELDVFYQPKVLIETGEIIGCEALVRWLGLNGNSVSPEEFIPVAEDTGMIHDIGEWVFRTVCKQTKVWVDENCGKFQSAINVSARQIDCVAFPEFVGHCLLDSGLNPDCLCIEITESAVMKDIELSLKTLQMIRQMGVRISMDDFGTGYSSLSNLKLLPIDELKIDKSFIRNIPEIEDDSVIVRAITQMAHTLGLKIVAEGIEKQTQLNFVRSLGCHVMQGYYFSPPVPASEMERMLELQMRNGALPQFGQN